MYKALVKLGCDKVPSLDGYTIAFWVFCQETVKTNVMKFFEEFHVTWRFSKAINSTFLVLIPKKEGADNIKDFRPISLVGSL